MKHPFRFVNDPEARERLMNRDVVSAAYRDHTIVGAAKALGTTAVPFARALRLHGIRIRARGEAPPGRRITRKDVKLAVLRAYAKSDRCPPSCPGREGCLDGECVLWELIG